MAGLDLQNELEFALGTPGGGGDAVYTVNPSGTPGNLVDIWERTISFPPVGGTFSVPEFSFVDTFDQPTPRTVPLNIGELYQVLLYEKGKGNKSGTGDVLARRSFPCVLREGGRTSFMTQCTESPQIDIRPGGTFVSMSVSGAAVTMARVQLCSEKPFENEAGVPTFLDRSIVANAVSVPSGPKFLHRLTPTDRRLLAGSTLFFVVFTWDRNGRWDYLWHTKPDAASATTPAVQPETLTLRRRMVTAKLVRLGYLDDSDDITNGEGFFDFRLRHGGPGGNLSSRINVATLETNTSLTISPPRTLTIGPEVVTLASQKVTVDVYGHEDDSGTPPFDKDKDDTASTGEIELDLPIGENLERLTDRFLSLSSQRLEGEDLLSFVADVLYSVSYS